MASCNTVIQKSNYTDDKKQIAFTATDHSCRHLFRRHNNHQLIHIHTILL